MCCVCERLHTRCRLVPIVKAAGLVPVATPLCTAREVPRRGWSLIRDTKRLAATSPIALPRRFARYVRALARWRGCPDPIRRRRATTASTARESHVVVAMCTARAAHHRPYLLVSATTLPVVGMILSELVKCGARYVRVCELFLCVTAGPVTPVWLLLQAGYFCVGGIRTECPAGSASNTSAINCTVCQPGEYNVAGMLTCDPCPGGYFCLDGHTQACGGPDVYCP